MLKGRAKVRSACGAESTVGSGDGGKMLRCEAGGYVMWAAAALVDHVGIILGRLLENQQK